MGWGSGTWGDEGSGGGGGGGGGGTPPSVVNWLPSTGTSLGAFTPVECDVRQGDAALRLLLFFVRYTNGDEELVYDGNDFTRPYHDASRITALGGGSFHMLFRRTGGWPQSPSFRYKVIDTAGNAAA